MASIRHTRAKPKVEGGRSDLHHLTRSFQISTVPGSTGANTGKGSQWTHTIAMVAGGFKDRTHWALRGHIVTHS